MKFHILGLIYFSLIFFGCKKDNLCSNLEEGTIISSSSFCNHLIELEDGTWLEPTNLDEFNSEFEVGEQIKFGFHETESASFCMMGKIVEIDCLIE